MIFVVGRSPFLIIYIRSLAKISQQHLLIGLEIRLVPCKFYHPLTTQATKLDLSRGYFVYFRLNKTALYRKLKCGI